MSKKQIIKYIADIGMIMAIVWASLHTRGLVELYIAHCIDQSSLEGMDYFLKHVFSGVFIGIAASGFVRVYHVQSGFIKLLIALGVVLYLKIPVPMDIKIAYYSGPGYTREYYPLISILSVMVFVLFEFYLLF